MTTRDPSGDSGPGYPWWQAVALFLGTAAAYILLPFFAPTELAGSVSQLLLGVVLGIVVGVACRLEFRLVPAMAVGATVGVAARFAWSPQDFGVTVGIAAIIGGQVWLMTYLLRRTGAVRLADPGDLITFGLAVLAVTAPAGLLVTSLAAIDGPEAFDFAQIWRTWVIDDLFGLVCIAPAVITFHRPSAWSWGRGLEWSIAVLYTAVSVTFVFFVVEPFEQGLLGWPYFIVLGSLWIAVRLGMQAVAPVVAVSFWVAVVATIGGAGAFSGASSQTLDRLLAVELFCTVMAVIVFSLATLRDSRLVTLEQVESTSRLLREVIEGTDAVIFAKSYAGADAVQGRYVLVNGRWEEVFGVPKEETVEHSDREIFPPDTAEAILAFDREVLRSNTSLEHPEVVADDEGGSRQFRASRFPLRRADGSAWGVGGISHDLTQTLAAADREKRQAELLHAVFDLSPTPAIRLSMDEGSGLNVTAANGAMCLLLGVPPGDFRACDLMEHVHPADAGTAMSVITFASSPPPGARRSRERELRLRTENGRTVWVVMSAASVQGQDGAREVVVQFEDFTARRSAEQALSDQAMRDIVTGLPNRRSLHERMDAALQRLRRHPGLVTVLFCDLDHFKDVNDGLGHHVGDLLLVEVADRLRSVLRPEDTIARLGGDEFVALGEGFADVADAARMAARLQDRLSLPWTYQDQVFRPAMSIGIAATSDADTTADELLRRADLAMYRAKEAGRDRVEVYDRSVDEERQRSIAIQRALRRAIDTDELVLLYQPIVQLADAAIVGAEALVRLKTGDGGLLSPVEFVPQAEATGLVVPMGAWVVQRVMADAATIRAAGAEVKISVNVSPAQLREEGFADYLLEQASLAGVRPEWIAVEVTETALIHDPVRSGFELAALSSGGVGVSLDDFGTGYSSLTWLTQFPVDVVKIDKSFTDDVGIDERKTSIVTAVIAVSHELGFTVVAEGIESEEQRARLLDLGCDLGQGYLFGRPARIDEDPWA